MEADSPAHAWLRHMRHELRTPVNHILAFAQLVREDAEDVGDIDVVDQVRAIEQAGQDALATIGQMLTDDQHRLSLQSLEAGAARIQEAMDSVEEGITRLKTRAEAASDPGFVGDLDRIGQGCSRLLALLGEVLAASELQMLLELDGEPADEERADGHRRLSGPVPTVGRSPNVDVPFHARTAPERAPVVPGRILVVEDNELNREALVRMLERLGHTVRWTENGRDALAVLGSEPVDLVLLDIMMPVMDGYQVLEHRRASATLRDIPFLMISALDELSSVVRCIEMGAEDYLPKPFDPVLLRARIGACLEKKRLRDMEVEYLRQVEAVTAAAGAVEGRTFQSDSLAEVAERGDALGQLARVFRRMANEVITREDQLRRQIEYLQFEVDEARKTKEVSQITDSEYFRDLQQRASALRSRVRTKNSSV